MPVTVNFTLPPGSMPWANPGGTPAQAFAQYMSKLDALVRQLASANFSSLTNATDDAAAAAAGVSVGQLYRNGSQVMIRVS